MARVTHSARSFNIFIIHHVHPTELRAYVNDFRLVYRKKYDKTKGYNEN